MSGRLFNPWKNSEPDSDSGSATPPGVWIVAGLGNPGSKYERTRHNVGFAVLDAWASRESVRFSEKREWKCHCAEFRTDGQRVILIKPQTYMNASGESLRAACDWFKAGPDQVMILVDDTALPSGHIRFRAQGSSGGHNGLKSVIAHLGTEQFARGRIGVGEKPHPEADLSSHVLGVFTPEEWTEMVGQTIPDVIAGVELWMRQGIVITMNQYNNRKKDPP